MIVTIVLPLPDPDKPREHEACCPLCKNNQAFDFHFIYDFSFHLHIVLEFLEICRKSLKNAFKAAQIQAKWKWWIAATAIPSHSLPYTSPNFFYTNTHTDTQCWVTFNRLSAKSICFIYSLFRLSQSIFHVLFSHWFHFCFGQFIFIFESAIFMPFNMPPRSTVSFTVFIDFRFYFYTCVLNWIYLHANLVFLPLFLALNLSKWYIM